MNKQWSYYDLQQDCQVEEGCYSFRNSAGLTALGLKIMVPAELFQKPPYNASAYVFLQALRKEIQEFGVIEFPNLPLNKQNYTVAIRAPWQHDYSDNPYLTDSCQSPHQDTPPHPTAFWLGETRRQSATWIMSDLAMQQFYDYQTENPRASIEEVHQLLVPQSIENKTGLLLNHTPGLLLVDNSEYCHLYHAKTCQFDAVKKLNNDQPDSPMYSFNEIGLLHYIDTLDSRRGQEDRDENEAEQVKKFMCLF